MNNKEKSLREMCERERERDARMVTSFLRKQLNVATFSTSRLRHTESCGNETRI